MDSNRLRTTGGGWEASPTVQSTAAGVGRRDYLIVGGLPPPSPPFRFLGLGGDFRFLRSRKSIGSARRPPLVGTDAAQVSEGVNDPVQAARIGDSAFRLRVRSRDKPFSRLHFASSAGGVQPLGEVGL